MNKKELIDKIAHETGKTLKETEGFLKSFLKVTTEELKMGEEVRLVGFGTFKVMDRKERKGINPKTLESIDIPGKRVPKFVPGKELKDQVSE